VLLVRMVHQGKMALLDALASLVATVRTVGTDLQESPDAVAPRVHPARLARPVLMANPVSLGGLASVARTELGAQLASLVRRCCSDPSFRDIDLCHILHEFVPTARGTTFDEGVHLCRVALVVVVVVAQEAKLGLGARPVHEAIVAGQAGRAALVRVVLLASRG
jgi:hypothetical protein